jgi:hypothetical protein
MLPAAYQSAAIFVKQENSFSGDTAELKTLLDEEMLACLRHDAILAPYRYENQSIFKI